MPVQNQNRSNSNGKILSALHPGKIVWAVLFVLLALQLATMVVVLQLTNQPNYSYRGSIDPCVDERDHNPKLRLPPETACHPQPVDIKKKV